MNVKANECATLAKNIRTEMLDTAERVTEAVHWGGCLSCVEILAVLYHCVLNGKTEEQFQRKDKFLLSKGHAALAVYTAMHQEKLMSDELYATYRADGSPLSELMHYDSACGFETSGGSLGLGVSCGVGLALMAKKKGYRYQTYVLVGDGELDEGNVWEAFMSACQFRLDNLTVIVDANTLQSDGETVEIMDLGALGDKFRSFGFDVCEVDGHDCGALLNAFQTKRRTAAPRAVIAHTVKGKGVSFMENNGLWHDRRLAGDELIMARREAVSCWN